MTFANQKHNLMKLPQTILAWLHLRRREQTLLLDLDGELSTSEAEIWQQHRNHCTICRQAHAQILASRALLRAGDDAPLVPTQRMWLRLTRALASTKPASEASFAYTLRWAVVATLVLFGGALVLRYAGKPRAEQTQLAAVIDYSIFFDALQRDATPHRFYERYPAQEMQLEEAQRVVGFPLAAIELLPASFQLQSVRVLECSGVKCVQLTCINDGKTINIFQHKLGQPWTFGQYALARAPICKTECLLVNEKELTAVSWQGSHSEYLAVGQLAPLELAQIVQALR